MINRIYTGIKDFTIRKMDDGIELESVEMGTAKEIFRVAKKERTENGYLITTISGFEYELYKNEYNEEDINTVKVGSIAGYWTTEKEAKLCVGFSTNYIDAQIKKYFLGA